MICIDVEQNREFNKESYHTARQMLSELKEKLKSEFQPRNLINSERYLSEYEKAFVLPALQQANAKLTVKTNSIPSKIWFSELYEIRSDVKHYFDAISNLVDKKISNL